MRHASWVVPIMLIAMAFLALSGPRPMRALAAKPDAGIMTLTLTDPVEGGSMSAVVTYPVTAGAGSTSLGPVVINATQNAQPAPGTYPLVVVSHGTGGTRLGHHTFMTALARAGFVVAAVEHPRDNFRDDSGFATDLQLIGRSHHIVALIDGIMAHSTIGPLIDKARGVGMIGHSAGGYTALLSAGAIPDFNLSGTYRAAVPDDFYMRRAATVERQPTGLKVVGDPRIRAAVLMAPALGYVFDKAALAGVQIPMRICRPEADELLPHPWHAERIAHSLPNKPEYEVVEKAGHFVFLAPCSSALASTAAVICTDPPGVDRTAIHARLSGELADFFRRTLIGKP